jgi:deoxyribose-phosphate aldolase
MHTTATKLAEARELHELGAAELDLVINRADLRNDDRVALRREIQAFCDFCRAEEVVSKIILETGELSREEIRLMCDICVAAGADMVKTSTGYAASGADLDTVRYMRQLLPAQTGIKASGGIRDYTSALAFIEAGATRIGTSTLLTDPS